MNCYDLHNSQLDILKKQSILAKQYIGQTFAYHLSAICRFVNGYQQKFQIFFLWTQNDVEHFAEHNHFG